MAEFVRLENAAMVDRGAGRESGMRAEELQRARRADRGARHMTGVGIHAARHVERKDIAPPPNTPEACA